MSTLTRRNFLRALGIGAGACVGTRLGGAGFWGQAQAATTEPTSVVLVWLDGGINPIFTGADAFTNTAFGVTANNSTAVAPGIVIDNLLANAIPASLRSKVACVGIRHGISDHGQARARMFAANNTSGPLALASAIGGTGALKAAVVGGNALPSGQRPSPVGGVSLQGVNDMAATIEAVSGATPAANAVDRNGALAGIAAAEAMSKATAERSPKSLASVVEGRTAAIETLKKPVQPFSTQEFNTAYRLQGTAVRGFTQQMAAAELMVRTGTNFVLAIDRGWDTHGDRQGTTARNMFGQRIAPGLQTFLSRVVEQGMNERNVVVAILGDFHRSLPGSDHQANLSALVIGKRLKNATTGKTDARVSLPGGTPSIDGFWQFLSAAAGVDQSPFGANPHPSLIA